MSAGLPKGSSFQWSVSNNSQQPPHGPANSPPGINAPRQNIQNNPFVLRTPGQAVPFSTPKAPVPRPPSFKSHGDQQLISESGLKILSADHLEDQGAMEIIKMMADEFVQSVTSFACKLAKHRGSDTLDAMDVQKHLARNWGIVVPIVGDPHTDSPSARLKKRSLESHSKRLHAVKKAKK